MTTKIKTVITKLNKACDELDFINARRLIELNFNSLSEGQHYRQLNTSARILIKHVQSNMANPDAKLTRLELLTIQNINQYSSDFDISMLKRTLKHSIALLQRNEVRALLNKDAIIILENMGIILGVPTLQKNNKN